eukprot:scaffold8227_cov72-Phaeocystis_antarctica.AAC.6
MRRRRPKRRRFVAQGRTETEALERREHHHAVLASHPALLVRRLVLGVDFPPLRDRRDKAHRLVRLLQSQHVDHSGRVKIPVHVMVLLEALPPQVRGVAVVSRGAQFEAQLRPRKRVGAAVAPRRRRRWRCRVGPLQAVHLAVRSKHEQLRLEPRHDVLVHGGNHEAAAAHAELLHQPRQPQARHRRCAPVEDRGELVDGDHTACCFAPPRRDHCVRDVSEAPLARRERRVRSAARARPQPNQLQSAGDDGGHALILAPLRLDRPSGAASRRHERESLARPRGAHHHRHPEPRAVGQLERYDVAGRALAILRDVARGQPGHLARLHSGLIDGDARDNLARAALVRTRHDR